MVNNETTLSGEENGGFLVRIINDSILEDDETFSLTLLTPGSNIVILDDQTTEIIIQNDDGKVFQVQWTLANPNPFNPNPR